MQRIEYEPGTGGPKTGEGTMFLGRLTALGECIYFIKVEHERLRRLAGQIQTKKRVNGGEGDIVDEMFDQNEVCRTGLAERQGVDGEEG